MGNFGIVPLLHSVSGITDLSLYYALGVILYMNRILNILYK